MTTNHSSKPLTAFLAIALAGCAAEALGPTKNGNPPTDGHAYLKIVVLDNSASKELVVKYVDDGDQPLAGTIAFQVSGDLKGGRLSATSGVTGADGSVHINVIGGATGEAFVKVSASAEFATPVDWSVSVKAGTQPMTGPLNVIGTYQLESEFNLVNGIPGTAGDVVRTVIDLTDGPNDPSTWVLDKIAGTGSGAKSALDAVRPTLDAVLNSLLAEASQLIVIDGVELDIVGAFKKFGNAFGDAANKFGVKSTFQIYAGPGSTLLGKHTITGVFFRVDTKKIEKTLGELDMDNIVIDKIPVTLASDSKLVVGDEDIALSYGKLIVAALDNVVIPLLDPAASNLEELLTDIVPCDTIADKIEEKTGIGASFWESLCSTGLKAGSAIVEGELGRLGDAATAFRIHGEVRPVDNNSDRKVDLLVGGLWEGQLTLAGQPAVLAKPMQTFSGTRMGN
jgi:hypothetical protein